MAEKLIGSLLYGDHPARPKPGAWKKRLKIPLAIGVILLAIGLGTYKFINYKEEGRVREFLEDVRQGKFEAAYAQWNSNGRYAMSDFLQDWGSDGYYMKGATDAKVVNSHGQGSNVIVEVAIDKFDKPIALRVDKSSMKLSFAPGTR